MAKVPEAAALPDGADEANGGSSDELNSEASESTASNERNQVLVFSERLIWKGGSTTGT